MMQFFLTSMLYFGPLLLVLALFALYYRIWPNEYEPFFDDPLIVIMTILWPAGFCVLIAMFGWKIIKSCGLTPIFPLKPFIWFFNIIKG